MADIEFSGQFAGFALTEHSVVPVTSVPDEPNVIGRKYGGPDRRGSNKDRAARESWMKDPDTGFGGNKKVVPCIHCGTKLEKPEADRVNPNGTYRHTNIQPSCPDCNKRRGNNRRWQGPKSIPIIGRRGSKYSFKEWDD